MNTHKWPEFFGTVQGDLYITLYSRYNSVAIYKMYTSNLRHTILVSGEQKFYARTICHKYENFLKHY